MDLKPNQTRHIIGKYEYERINHSPYLLGKGHYGMLFRLQLSLLHYCFREVFIVLQFQLMNFMFSNLFVKKLTSKVAYTRVGIQLNRQAQKK